MTATNFAQSLAFVLKSEGGYSDDIHDPGGATMNGIIQREYTAYLAKHGLPNAPVRDLHTAERDDIYRSEYWNEVNGDGLASGLDYCVFDAGVNSGIGRGREWLKESGPDIDAFCNRRLTFLKGLKNWKYFGGGWGIRVEFVRRNAKAMASGDPIHDTAWVQASLNKLGASPSLSVDGVEGAATIAAIKKFQAAHDLTVDGLAGPATVAKVDAALAALTPSPPVTSPLPPAAVPLP